MLRHNMCSLIACGKWSPLYQWLVFWFWKRQWLCSVGQTSLIIEAIGSIPVEGKYFTNKIFFNFSFLIAF